MPDLEYQTHHSDQQADAKEQGVADPMGNLDPNLKPGDKQVANYLIHRMIWDGQEKAGNVVIDEDGTMKIRE
ncbi:MAG TPA: hypothetical protein PKA10_03475 [Selenomonadales bacterium]|nr:hypothetical protein [Selenomonadales bacterium]